MNRFELDNKIHEIRSYIASSWPGIEERKHLYQKLSVLEKKLKEMDESQDKLQEEKET